MVYHIFGVWGLMGGPTLFTEGLSHGVDTLIGKVTRYYSNISWCGSYSYWDGGSIKLKLEEIPEEDIIIFVGHSNGVHTITSIASEYLNRKFIIAGIDGTWIWPEVPHKLGSNVIAAFSVVGVNNNSLCGHSALKAEDGVNVHIEHMETETLHAEIDDDGEVQDRVLKFLEKVIN